MTNRSSDNLRILVVGGGVAGGLIGGWLSGQKGVDVTVAERVAADDHANAGNGLNVGPNGLKMLASVWPEKVAELRSVSLPWTQWLARRADGTIAYDIPLSSVSSEPGIRIRWSELYRLARSSALDCLQFETSVTKARKASGDEGAVRISMETKQKGSFAKDFDLVIVAEGRYSRLREQLGGVPEARQLGIANFRTLLDDGGSIQLDDMEQWFNGPARVIAFRLRDGLIYISGNLPIEVGAPVTDEMKTKAYLRDAYTPQDGPMDSRLAQLVDGFCATESIHHWARAQQIDTRWTDLDDRVLYLGDAAHAMAPTLGQGATQAIEDAAAWMRLFSNWKASGGDASNLSQFTKAFARVRSDRIAFVRQLSEEASDLLLIGSNTEACIENKCTPDYKAKLTRLYQDLPLSNESYLEALEVTPS